MDGAAHDRGMVGNNRGVGEDMASHAYLAVELDTSGEPSAAHHVAAAEAVARSGADLVIWADSFVAPDPAEPPTLDAVAVAARVAPVVGEIGLVPTITVTHTEPFHISKAIATLDIVSMGRAGWQVDVSRTEEEARQFGRKPAAPPAVLWREAAEAVEVVVRLWDSWEDDAVLRDLPTGRYVDRDRLHYIDFVGEFFSVKGPSITPRSPQAHPLVVVRDEAEALPVVAAWADVVRVTAPDLAAAHTAREQVRTLVAGAGRDPEAVAVLLDLPLEERPDPAAVATFVAEAVGGGAADGVTLLGAPVPDLAARLAERGLRRPVAADATLRERFGLSRPADHFAGARS
jgi:alkanesulfonate monooxygenase SsuD/methylene tetrahydromethanopterin reductase-like flavin-dependent oxidoreductase (luciferase family)